MDPWAVLLVLAAASFAWSIGAHYTGACMGMSYAAHAIRLRTALVVMAPLSLVGAAIASGAVQTTVGSGLLAAPILSLPLGFAIVGSAFLLTTIYNSLKLPTSTIQILVFSVVGAGAAAGVPVVWPTIGHLLVVWAVVPPAAAGVAWGVTRATARRASDSPNQGAAYAWLGGLLVATGAGASFVMGANDVSNASGAFVMTQLFSPTTAALVGGAGIAVGVLTWGRPLLQRVAFETVELDRRTASIAQFTQAGLVLVAVLFGYFTSLNQALVGAMAGTGLARGRRTVRLAVLRGILIGWAVGPVSGFLLTFTVVTALNALGVPV